jgi:hypothetical protein
LKSGPDNNIESDESDLVGRAREVLGRLERQQLDPEKHKLAYASQEIIRELIDAITWRSPDDPPPAAFGPRSKSVQLKVAAGRLASGEMAGVSYRTACYLHPGENQPGRWEIMIYEVALGWRYIYG